MQYVTIKSPANSPNTDGIDPADAHNIVIDHCLIDTGDDDVAIKSGDVDPKYPNAGSSNVTISNNVFLHGHGVSIGSETNGGVQNVHVMNDTFQGTKNGIRIKSTRSNGGNVGGVVYSHLTMTNVTNAIIISGYYPTVPADGDPKKPITATTPYFHDISIDNLTATNVTSAGYIIGLPEKPFTNISLSQVQISAATGLTFRNAAIAICTSTMTVSSGKPYTIQSHIGDYL